MEPPEDSCQHYREKAYLAKCKKAYLEKPLLQLEQASRNELSKASGLECAISMITSHHSIDSEMLGHQWERLQQTILCLERLFVQIRFKDCSYSSCMMYKQPLQDAATARHLHALGALGTF